MPKKNPANANIPDEEILRHPNVPLALAAKYIGSSSTTVRYALQDERVPFGFAARNPETDTWAYNISPQLLIKYKHGDLPTYRLGEVQKIFVEGAEQLLNTKLQGLNQFFAKVCGV